jgi:hypothetical protein
MWEHFNSTTFPWKKDRDKRRTSLPRALAHGPFLMASTKSVSGVRGRRDPWNEQAKVC